MTRRGGFTLLEVLLVAGLMCVLAAVVLPATAPIYERAALRRQAARVVTLLAEARETAFSEGQVRWVRRESGGPALLAGAEGEGFAIEFALEDAIAFDVADDADRLAEWELGDGLADYQDLSWSPAVLFFPDGSSSGGRVPVVDDSGRTLTVEISALTGRAEITAGGDDEA
ncbi:MAG: GspH/FimT family pseudopilin [Planctomycetota bacterium]